MSIKVEIFIWLVLSLMKRLKILVGLSGKNLNNYIMSIKFTRPKPFLYFEIYHKFMLKFYYK
jgi:hypothetical protein